MNTPEQRTVYAAASSIIRSKVTSKQHFKLAVRSVGILCAVCVLLVLPLHLVASTQVNGTATATAVITLSVKVQPNSRQDFRFHGALGDFRLDQAAPDDGDEVTQTITFTVSPGVYAITEEPPQTWQMSAISCTPRALGQIDLQTGKATLTVQAGERVHCTFVNDRGVTVRTRVYRDRSGNRSYTLGDPYLPAWTISLYRDVNILIGTQLTNQYGKAHFNYVPPGDYTACQTTTTGWSNSQPGVDDATYGAPCYTLTLRAGEISTLWFGNQQADDTPPAQSPTTPRAIAIAQDADVTTDASGYDGWHFVDTDLNQDERGPTVFLPITVAP